METADRRILWALLALALVVRMALFFGGVRGSDAYAYAHEAYNIATGQYDVQAETMFYGFRYAVLLPTALAYKLFGVSDWSSALFPLLASLVTLWLIVRLGAILLSRSAGLLGGILYIVFPLSLPGATLLGPDSFIPMLSAGALLAFWRAGGEATPARTRAALYLVTGLCIGLATQARETSLLLLFSVAGLAACVRRWDGGIWKVLLGCLVPLLAESLFYWMETGDPLYRATVIQTLNEFYVGQDPEGPTSWTYYPQAMFGLDLGGLAWFGFFVYLALASLGVGVWRRELGRLLPLLLWAGPPFLYMEFGSMSWLRYVPIVKAYPYLSIISVPLVLSGAYGLAALLEPAKAPAPGTQRQRTGWPMTALVAAVVVGLALTSLYGTYRLRENIRDDARPYQMVASSVQAHPEHPIYVPHQRWTMFLNYYLRYQTGFNYYSRPGNVGSGRLRYLWEMEDPALMPPAYVVLHDRYLFYDTIGRSVGKAARLPAYAFSPPASWRVIVRERAEPAYNSFALYETGSAARGEGGAACFVG